MGSGQPAQMVIHWAGPVEGGATGGGPARPIPDQGVGSQSEARPTSGGSIGTWIRLVGC